MHVCGIDLLRNPYTSREALIAAIASGTAGAALLRPPVVLCNTSGAFAHPNKIYLSLTHVHTPLGGDYKAVRSPTTAGIDQNTR